MKSSKPPVKRQGTIIAERQGILGVWLVMFPDGRIKSCWDKAEVAREAKRYFKRTANQDAINVGYIEWRYQEPIR